MAIAARTGTGAGVVSGNATTIVINKPTGTTADDLLLFTGGANLGATESFSLAGWTRVPNFTLQSQGSNTLQDVLYRIADGTEGATFTFTCTTTGHLSGAVNAYSGVDPNNPFAGIAEAGAASTTTVAFPTGTPQAESVYAVLLATDGGTVAQNTATTAPSGYTNSANGQSGVTRWLHSSICDSHTVYTNIPLSTVAPGSGSITNSASQSKVTLFLRPDLSTNTTTLATDAMTAFAVGSAVTTLAAPTVSTGYAETIVVEVASSATTQPTSVSDNTGLTWTLRASTIVQTPGVWIYTAQSTGAIPTLTVSVNFGVATTCRIRLTTFVNGIPAGANPIGATQSANSASSATYSASLTTLGSGSWVQGLLTDSTNIAAFSAGASQQALSSNTTTIATFSTRQNATTPAAGTSVAISGTMGITSSYNEIAYEVKQKVSVSSFSSTLMMMGV